MYRIIYFPDLSDPDVQIKTFDSYKSLMYFATKFQVDGHVLEIKWCPNDKSNTNN
jgi:hypothetical protein